MIVDDCPIAREVVAALLERHGFAVLCLDDLFSFARQLNEARPDLVLLDVEMPALDGPSVLSVARRHNLHRCPVVLYSARPAAELEQLAASCGADGYIEKTSSGVTLFRAVDRFFRQAAQRSC